ncbi:hypothetical protein G210_1810, partial [Candida maltosa Xu316]
MIAFLRLFLYTQLIAFAAAADILISENTVSYSLQSPTNIGSVTVKSSFFWSLTNVYSITVKGILSVEDGASFFFTSGSEKNSVSFTMDHLNSKFINNGIVSFDSTVSNPISNYKISPPTFENNGKLFLATSKGSLQPVTKLESAVATNDGLISVYTPSTSANQGKLEVGVHSKTMSNTGNICVYNQYLSQNGLFEGNGCITLFEKSKVHFRTRYASNQIVVFGDGTGILHSEDTTDASWKVYNFGKGNIIELHLGLDQFSYDANTGFLMVRYLSYEKFFDIGFGYNPDLFQKADALGSKYGVTYNGDIPSSANTGNPCGVKCEKQPTQQAPGAHATTYTITVVKTTDGTTTTV